MLAFLSPFVLLLHVLHFPSPYEMNMNANSKLRSKEYCCSRPLCFSLFQHSSLPSRHIVPLLFLLLQLLIEATLLQKHAYFMFTTFLAISSSFLCSSAFRFFMRAFFHSGIPSSVSSSSVEVCKRVTYT